MRNAPVSHTTHPDLNLLRTFLAVYRAGSFTAGAGLVGLSQPTVTAQIRALEQETGQELFVRLPRGVQPTAPAHELAARVADPLDALEGRTAVNGAAKTPAPVRLAGPSELLCTRVLPALAPLVADGVRLRVSAGLTEPLVDELRAGRQDLVIATRRPRGRALASVPLADEEYVLVASPDWVGRIRQQLPSNLKSGEDACQALCAALRDVPLVAYAEDLPIIRRYWRLTFGKQHAVEAAVTVPNLYAVVSAVAAGAGFSVLPRSLCEEHFAKGAIESIHDPAEPPLNTLFLVIRPDPDANPDIVRIRDVLQSAARSW